MFSLRKQPALIALALCIFSFLVVGSSATSAATNAQIGPAHTAHAYNTYNQACSPSVYSYKTGGFTSLCFDLTGTYLGGGQWRLRESGWASDRVTPIVWHFQLRDWICNAYDPPDYYYTSGAVWSAAIVEAVTTNCGPEMDSGNSWGGGSSIGGNRGVQTFSVWN